MRRLSYFFLSIFACLACSDGASAHPRGPGAPYIVTLEDASGHELRTFHHRGETFILGNYGERYNIRVRNRTGQRVEAVVTVDGRDVVSGDVGDFVSARGYLIDAYDEVLIEGFRQSLSHVASFRFTDPGDSYSSRMGTPENVGVVGVAIFPERTYPRPIARPSRPKSLPRYGRGRSEGAAPTAEAPARRSSPRARRPAARGADGSMLERSAGSGASSAEAYADDESSTRQNLGTEYGESRYSSVREVSFRRASPRHPARIITLRYDDREGLLARGIRVTPPRPYRVSQHAPEAFPHNRFAPPPPR